MKANVNSPPPSCFPQLVEVPDFTFGSGKSARIPESSMKRITERIRSELRVDREDLGEYKRLVTGLLAETGKEGSATLQGRKLKGSELGGGAVFGDTAAGGGAGPAAGETMGADMTVEEVRAARAEQERRLAELQVRCVVCGVSYAVCGVRCGVAPPGDGRGASFQARPPSP